MNQLWYAAGLWVCIFLGTIALFGPKELMLFSSHWIVRIIGAVISWWLAYWLNKKILANKNPQEWIGHNTEVIMGTDKRIALWIVLICAIAYIIMGIINVFGIDVFSPKGVRNCMIGSSIGFVASAVYLLYSRWPENKS